MATVSLDALLEAGVHFGHRVSRWNPKMSPYIYGKRNLIHIIDLKATIRGLIRATHFLSRLTGQGKQVLFVGTKRQAKGLMERAAQALEMPHVSDRWIGGLLTNNEVVRRRLKRLFELEKMEEDGRINQFKKKEISALRREKRRILRNLDGVRGMEGLPGALVVVDPNRERTAVLEANRLNIPVVAFLDTDCDPDLVDIPIPGNDDAMRSIEVVMDHLVSAVAQGRKAWQEQKAAEEKARREREEQERREREMIEAARRRRAAEQAAAEAAARAAAEAAARAAEAAAAPAVPPPPAEPPTAAAPPVSPPVRSAPPPPDPAVSFPPARPPAERRPESGRPGEEPSPGV
ncbi:MAG: 30S ribosomal protein S2 [Planctomycetes bacterium]|nr:30S ribosomal protein S2 [Planctomycetota bacterium]